MAQIFNITLFLIGQFDAIEKSRHLNLCQKNDEYLRVILVLDKVELLLDSFASLCDPQLEGTPTAALSENEISYNSKNLLIL